jgi:HTH-type transcriptional regulator/antitoxin HigA
VTETNYAVAPGEYLKEWLEEQDLSLAHGAVLLGWDLQRTVALADGSEPVTVEMAAVLERAVGIPADAWLRYEAAYRADMARIAKGTCR